MVLDAGTRLGPYEIVALLGRGGMGEVYRARDTRLDREVAVKVLPPMAGQHADASERFRREARAASALSHPHVCAVYDLGEHDGRHFIVMELLEGSSLQDILRTGPLAATRAIDIVIDIAEGLQAAHDKGIVHRDLKPANLFVTSHGRGKVLDFGVAKLVEPTADALTVAGLTSVGQVLGTAAYMSPEQARGERVDARTDLFAVGLVLYEMLAGHPAITGPTTAVMFDTLLNKPVKPLREMSGPQVPAAVDAIVARLLAKEPSARYQSARALVDDLRAARRTFDGGSGPRAARGEASTPSVAVLPFASLSPDSENEYLADGITEEVISALGRVQGLHVPGRVSCFAFKGKAVDVAEVAAKLKVSNVLTGSVRRSGNRLRIAAELVSAETGFQLWSERFDRSADDVFAIQDEIASNIAEKLKGTLASESTEPLVRRATGNLDAYAAYLRGRFFLNQRGESIKRGLDAFNQALALDPTFALAHSGLAEALSLVALYGYSAPRSVLPAAEAAARRALELDPDLAEPHTALQIARYSYDWDWAGAEAEFNRAIAKNPKTVTSLTTRAVELSAIHGRTDEAAALAQRAIEADPLSPHTYYGLALAHLCALRFPEARAAAERALEIHPGMWLVGRIKAQVLSMQGRHAETFALLDGFIAAGDPHVWLLIDRVEASLRAGDPADATAWATRILEMRGQKYVSPTAVAYATAVVDGVDAGFAALERAFEDHDVLPMLNYYPGSAILRRDPRWPAIMRRLGLEPAPHREH
jgi:TolB-like protein/Tfp pilus assembly protein PilF